PSDRSASPTLGVFTVKRTTRWGTVGSITPPSSNVQPVSLMIWSYTTHDVASILLSTIRSGMPVRSGSWAKLGALGATLPRSAVIHAAAITAVTNPAT